MQRYIKDGKLDVGQIHEVVPESVRISLLQWIWQANMSGTGKGSTEYGQNFVMKKQPGSCVLRCEDGDLRLPHYVLEFANE